MTKPNPNNKYPKKTEAAAIATKAMATKNHRKFIMSARYIMKNMPRPVVVSRSAHANAHVWPKQIGVTVGRTISSQEVHEMTTRMIVNANQNRTDLQMSCQTFLKAIKPFLPPSLTINTDWSNYRKRNCSDPTCIKVADELEEFAKDYFSDIESQLASLYLNVGDKTGAQYLKVLERRFREHWNTGSQMNLSASISKKEQSEETEPEKDTTITFNFEVVQTGSQSSEG